MKCPPSIVSMRVAEEERTRFRLWFPLFILWPLLLVLLLLTFIATLVADLFSLIAGHRFGYTRLILGVLRVVNDTRGTELFIQDRTHHSRTVSFTLR